ncbi:ABC transporter ATP-binding protein [Arthrobacter sp. AZCC_0090]|uniref:ABC transporter ATP-binding protein n=1 Tax=Arthrobacter sp. AZCC_0090 TaxID=2735881 RepID=UPI0017C2050F|nr:ABC transporter ATP-binding protein [Arthrobacter sp. AZCC_0090]MBB6407195.1 branched-chain amino acid transport system ATP-binding protein [Arthrobacter sp. AZCC_0090]
MIGLDVRDLVTGYGEMKIVRGVNFTCRVGEITALLGRNGAGKTTTLSAIAGLLPTLGGSISILGAEQTDGASQRIHGGLGLVQEGKRVFRSRSVEENLRLGGFIHRRRRGFISDGIEKAYERFPVLKTKRSDAAGMLSGGQQQMLAIAQALMAEPKVLMLDEPSAGLAPSVVDEVFGEINALKKEGLCVLLVEQLIDNSLAVADHVAVLDRGRITLDCPVNELGDWDVLRESYLGAPVIVEG